MLCLPFDGARKQAAEQKQTHAGSRIASFEDWFGAVSWVNTLYVWFPGCWAPSVVEAIAERNAAHLAEYPMQHAVFTADAHHDAVQSREVSFRINPWNAPATDISRCSKPVRGLLGWALMTRRSGRCSPYCVRESCRMCSRRELPPAGMVRPHFVLLYRFCYQGSASLRSGWISCKHKGTSGRHIWSRGSHTWTLFHLRFFAGRGEGSNRSISGSCLMIGSGLIRSYKLGGPPDLAVMFSGTTSFSKGAEVSAFFSLVLFFETKVLFFPIKCSHRLFFLHKQSAYR